MSHDLTPSAASYPVPAATVPDDGDDANAASVQLPFQQHEDALETIFSRLGGRSSGVGPEWNYPSTRGRNTRWNPLGGHALPVYVNVGGGGAATAVDTKLWRPHYLVSAGAGPGGRDIITSTGKWYTGLPLHTYQRPVDRLVMPGGTITAVTFKVNKGTAQATSTSRVSVSFYKVDLLGSITTLATGTANSSSGDETITCTLGTPEVYSPSTHNYNIEVTSSVGASSSDPDYIYGGTFTWTDPGPRN